MKVLTYKGETKTAREWSESSGVNYNTIIFRMNKGLSAEDVLRDVTTERRRKSKVLIGIEAWHTIMCQYFTKEHRIKCYKKLKSDYEDIKREAMVRAA